MRYFGSRRNLNLSLIDKRKSCVRITRCTRDKNFTTTLKRYLRERIPCSIILYNNLLTNCNISLYFHIYSDYLFYFYKDFYTPITRTGWHKIQEGKKSTHIFFILLIFLIFSFQKLTMGGGKLIIKNN